MILNKANKFWRLLPLCIIGIWINYYLISSADDQIFFDGIIAGTLLLIFLGVLLWINLKDYKEHKESKTKWSFLPTVVGFLLIGSFITTDQLLKARDGSPMILQAGTGNGIGTCWFEFREDGTYKFANSGGIGATYFRGNYTITDSIITLDKSDIDNVIKSPFLVIRTFSNINRNEEMLYQINKKHKLIDGEGFKINVDNRK